MIEGLYLRRGKPTRLHQLGKKIWGNLVSNRPYLTDAVAKTEDSLNELNWVKVGGKVVVMWND